MHVAKWKSHYTPEKLLERAAAVAFAALKGKLCPPDMTTRSVAVLSVRAYASDTCATQGPCPGSAFTRAWQLASLGSVAAAHGSGAGCAAPSRVPAAGTTSTGLAPKVGQATHRHVAPPPFAVARFARSPSTSGPPAPCDSTHRACGALIVPSTAARASAYRALLAPSEVVRAAKRAQPSGATTLSRSSEEAGGLSSPSGAPVLGLVMLAG
jgi:hypothetical protein